MKHGKNPTVRQRKLMQAAGLSDKDWLVSKDGPGKLVLVHRRTGEVKEVGKEVSL